MDWRLDNLLIYLKGFMEKVAIRLRFKPPKRRTPSQRLRARLYYRKNRAKIRVQRRRYLRTHKNIIKHRKMFMRFKPTWFKKPSHSKAPKPPHVTPHHKKFKLSIPKFLRIKKIPHLKPVKRAFSSE